MIVTRADLERHIARARAEIADPARGIYGPGSVSWRVDREAALFLGGGKAALLQLAHPFVAHAIDQHSKTRADPLGRFQRTFDSVHAMVFGDWDTAVAHARRVHTIHTRISGEIREDVGAFPRGSRYHANDEGALLWVYATLIDGALETHDLVLGTLTDVERERYYQESKRFARLFGISDDALPENLSAFRDYVRRMLESDVIRVGTPAREIAGFLFRSPRAVFHPLFHGLSVLTAGLLPARLRVPFGLSWTRSDRVLFRATLATLRRTYPRLPRRLRYVPAYVRAHRRLHGLEGPDRIGDFIQRLTTAPLAR